MSRKITKDATDAFFEGRQYNNSNTSVLPPDGEDWAYMVLYGAKVARHRDGLVQVSDGGFRSNTTKDRIHAVAYRCGSCVTQNKGVWYYDHPSGAQLVMGPNEWVTVREQTAMQMIQSALR